MPSIQGKILLSPATLGPADGLTVQVYKDSDFPGGLPAKNDALPVASPQATLTSGPAAGGSGYYRWTGAVPGQSYVAAILDGSQIAYDFHQALPGISTAGLELYLDSKLGLDAIVDGANFSIWPDQSGHGRDATAIMSQRPFLFRVDVNHISANNSPGVAWVGADAPNGALMTNALPNPMPSYAAGYTIAAYGRFKPSFNSASFSQVWQNTSGTGPQCWYEDNSGGKRYGFRDNAGNHFGSAFGASNVYGLLVWLFNPPNDGTGVAQVLLNGAAVYTGTWHETDGGASSGYIIGANQVDNGACFCDFFGLCWWSRALGATELTNLSSYFVNRFG